MKAPEQYEEIISSQQAEIANLHRQIAAERLRAYKAWQRYENANMAQKMAREELASMHSTIDKLTKLAYDMGKKDWKTACEDNGLLGEN